MRRGALSAPPAALAALALACGGAAPDAPPRRADPASARHLPAGEVVGFTGAYGGHVWLGLPYAAPPVGELRWRPPRPAPRWQGILEATAPGEACPQFASTLGGYAPDATGVRGSEDCLTLDVYAPRFEPGAVPSGGERLPVMVWIHGGASVGRSSQWNGGRLAATNDVVVVAINYRMAAFGSFRHPALLAEATTAEERTGNFGLLDQVRALEWVRDNVSAFGGDPGRVTIFGEGFGAFSVANLLLSPRARGLFQRAILQSNPGWGSASEAGAVHYADDPEPGHANSSSEVLARLLVVDGTAPDRAAAKAHAASLTNAAIARTLRGQSARGILAAYVDDADAHAGGYPFPGLVRDGVAVPGEPPMETLARGAYHRVPVVLGTARDEKKLVQALDPEFVFWRLGVAPRARDPEHYAAAAERHANLCRAGTVDEPASILRRVQGPSVFAYRFDWDEEPRIPFLYDGPALLGAAHGLVAPFVFGHFDLGPQTRFIFGDGSLEGRETLSHQMRSYWAAFAATGAPGRGQGGDLPEWAAWDDSSPEAPRSMLLDTPAGGGPRMTSETLTLERAVADLLADPRFPTTRDRCVALSTWGCLPRERHARIEACRGIALAVE